MQRCFASLHQPTVLCFLPNNKLKKKINDDVSQYDEKNNKKRHAINKDAIENFEAFLKMDGEISGREKQVSMTHTHLGAIHYSIKTEDHQEEAEGRWDANQDWMEERSRFNHVAFDLIDSNDWSTDLSADATGCSLKNCWSSSALSKEVKRQVTAVIRFDMRNIPPKRLKSFSKLSLKNSHAATLPFLFLLTVDITNTPS